jgi:hypothetical protein
MGTALLRGAGLHLAVNAAVTVEQQEWTRDQATRLLGCDEMSDVHAAATALVQLPQEVTRDVDVSLLAAHPYFGVRQAAAVLAIRQAGHHRDTAMRLTADRDVLVRRVLAAEAARAPVDPSGTLTTILKTLAEDVRHSVRAAAAASVNKQPPT